jgi:CYTH domain-containing protein
MGCECLPVFPLSPNLPVTSTMGVAKLTDQNTVVPESKYARIERERRYVLQDLPEGLTRVDPHLQITDNYITGTRLRLRKVRDPRTNKWTIKFTQKFAPDADDLSRTIITNTYLNALEADTLSIFNGNEIRKNRYQFQSGGKNFAIDMFLGDLFGLVLAEVSFETDEELDSFPQPSFAVADVTNNELFSGGKLSELKFSDLREEIVRLIKMQKAKVW